MKRFVALLAILIVFALAGCNAPTDTPVPTDTAAPSVPTNTAIPAPTSAPTDTLDTHLSPRPPTHFSRGQRVRSLLCHAIRTTNGAKFTGRPTFLASGHLRMNRRSWTS